MTAARGPRGGRLQLSSGLLPLAALLCAALVVPACRCGDAPGPVTVEYVQPLREANAEDAGAEAEGSTATNDVRVVEAKGRVEVKRGTAVDWREIKAGDRLGETDSVRTGDDSRLELELADIRVTVEERSELRVREVTETVLRAAFRGRVESRVTEDRGNELELQVDGTDTTLRTTGGEFKVNADGKGTVAVATVSGKVDFTARGRTVTVAKGEVSHQSGEGGPEAPRPALQRVMLSVQWPGTKETNLERVPVRGVVEVGSRVRVQGQYVQVDGKGRFTAMVPLKQGEQKVAVVATDVLGRRAQEETQLRVDRRAPTVDRENRPWE